MDAPLSKAERRLAASIIDGQRDVLQLARRMDPASNPRLIPESKLRRFLDRYRAWLKARYVRHHKGKARRPGL